MPLLPEDFMRSCLHFGAAVLGMAIGLTSDPAHAAEVRLAAAVGVRQVLMELAPQFEATTGHKVASTFEATGILVQQISGGAGFDVVIINRAGIENLARSRRVLDSTTADIASSIAAVAVRSEATKPDVSTPEAFKRALLEAKSIARPSPAVGGSSGDHITLVAERLGIASELNAKTVIASISRPPGRLVADGEAELALHQMQELMAVPGLDILGPFPGELQGSFMFSGAVLVGAQGTDAAKALIAFLRSPQSAKVIKAKGMAPAVAGD
jgi:molybdate transport system substrate-binding protein